VAYVPVAFILAGMAAYTVLAGADFGAGVWTLLALGRPGASGSAGPAGVAVNAAPSRQRLRDQARHAMGPVWEANHVWLIFVLVVCWTAYPVAFGAIASTLAAPLLIAAIGIIGRGAAYALRSEADASGAARLAENLLGVSSVVTPFALGTAVGAVATGRVPVGNAAGDPVTSWLAPAPVLIGVLAVAFSGYLAAVFLAADSDRYGEPALAAAFRRRALLAALAAGALALAGLLVMRGSGLDLTHGAALALVIVSAAAGLATLALCWRSAFGLARLTAALAVAAVVAGWAAAQAPRFLPGLTVTQAAAGRATLVALIIAVACGAVILVPSLALLFTLFLRGRLDTLESHDLTDAPTGPSDGAADAAGGADGADEADGAGATREVDTADAAGNVDPSEAAAAGAVRTAGEVEVPGVPDPTGADGSGADEPPPARSSHSNHSARSTHSTGPAGRVRTPGRLGSAGPLGAAAAVGLVAGGVLLVFTDAAWTHVLGVAGLVVCAVAVFALSASPVDR
jgi:cytochrome d ubiquinol oxidase subunit II